MLKIYVDSDSITTRHRSIIIKRAIKESLETFFVADRSLKDVEEAIADDTRRIRDDYRDKLSKEELRRFKSKLHMVVVEQGDNAADDRIIELLSSPALLITHDIPLSARAIEKGATVIDDRGNTLDENNINERLSIRSYMADLRELGVSVDKSKRFDPAVMNKFASAFDKAINNLLLEANNNIPN